jgi:FkbM family methyltransferase
MPVNILRRSCFRGKYRLMSALTPTRGSRRAWIHGALFRLDLEDFIQRSIYMGTYEQLETRVVEGILGPGMTFIDVGANVGYFSALGARLVGLFGRVLAFEPSPYAFGRLRTMIEESDLHQVKAIQAALSDCIGEGRLYLGKPGGGLKNHTPTMVPHENTDAIATRTTTLDAVTAHSQIDRIDLIKIDIEGYEVKALQGAKRLLRERRIRNFLCEVNSTWLNAAGSSSSDLMKLLRDHGFEHERIGRTDNYLFNLTD